MDYSDVVYNPDQTEQIHRVVRSGGELAPEHVKHNQQENLIDMLDYIGDCVTYR